MDARLRREIEEVLGEVEGKGASIASMSELEGGSINAIARIVSSSGKQYIVKSNAQAPEDFFEREAEGLKILAAAGAIRVPRPLVAGEASEGGPSYLMLEFIKSAPPGEGFGEAFGRALAELHRTEGKRFGFGADNYIGLSPQKNEWCDSWPEFFAERRLMFQFRRLEERGYATAELAKALDSVMGRLDSLIGAGPFAPSCLHGDLWSGNYLVDTTGAPVLIDPAVYYGDREADLAMTELFGRFDPKFYGAYREAYPLAAGFEERRDLYNLYHLMNHLGLFGLSYMARVMEILRRYV